MTTTLIPEAEVRQAIKAKPLTSREPAAITGVLLGALASAATAIAQAQTTEGLNLWALVPALAIIAVSVLIRSGVVSPARAEVVQDQLAQVAEQAATASTAIKLVIPSDYPVDQLVAAMATLGTAEIVNPDILPGHD